MKRNVLRARMMSQRGMTLVEIMVVIAIIGIVTTAIGFAVVGYMSDAKSEATRMQVKKVKQAAYQYYVVTGEAPGSLDALIERKYIKKNDKKDAWKSELRLMVNDSSDDPVQVCSDGPDKASGGDDDICEPESE
jgi:general secretion pathway protein G